jgi:hypothetical protein
MVRITVTVRKLPRQVHSSQVSIPRQSRGILTAIFSHDHFADLYLLPRQGSL